MKRSNIIIAILLSVVLVTVFAVAGNAQDKKAANKQEVKAQKVEKQGNSKDRVKLCEQKHDKGECKDHDHANCDPEKCDCDHKAGSVECLKKHATGDCKDHKPGECKQTEQAKKPLDNKKK